MIPLHAVRHVDAEAASATQAPVAQSFALAAPAPAVGVPRPEPRRSVALTLRAYGKLEYAQTLVSHRVVSGDGSLVVEMSLDDFIAKHEKVRFAATDRPRAARGRSDNPRYIPAWMKRAVWKQCQGRCTHPGENGHRCETRERLEFDHIIPVARGGRTTVENLRLRCRAHNQYEAERMFGAEFMRKKRRKR
jgi:hypothetical protein